ncbi:MAG: hypothetical protein R3C16_07705 [Hyphomonadaceae bacterium]
MTASNGRRRRWRSRPSCNNNCSPALSRTRRTDRGRTDGDGLRARGAKRLSSTPPMRARCCCKRRLRGPSSLPEQQAQPEEPQVDVALHGCLSQAIYYEARGETQRGQVAVAEVIMNRVALARLPELDLRGRPAAPFDRLPVHLFTRDGSLNQRPRGRAWDRTQRQATAVMSATPAR